MNTPTPRPAPQPIPVVRFLDRTTPPHIATLVLMSGLSAMSMNIFLPSLPAMARSFDAPYQLMQLSVSLYLALSAVLQLVIGPLSDRYGRRPVLLTCCGLFLLATVGTLIAPTAEIFLLFRMLQAVIAAGLLLSRTVVRDMVPDAQAASMIGYVTMGMSLVPMVSPIIGGALDEAFGWRANFVLLFVLGGLVTALAWADLGETARRTQTSLRDQVRQYPALLRSYRFWGYAVTAASASGAFFSFLGGAPYVGSVIYGMSPATLGYHFAAPAVGYLTGNFISGRLSMRVGIVRMVLAGGLVLFGGILILLVLTLAGVRHPMLFFGMMTAIGIGNGLTMPNANAGMMSVRPDLAGTASGLGGALMVAGGAALATLAGVVLQWGTTELPLVILMFCTSLISLGATLVVIRRNRQLGL